MRIQTTTVLALLLSALLWAPAPAFAKDKGKGKGGACRKEDARLAQTGVGDSDGDGLSDCREARLLLTSPFDDDSDDDGLDDGEEMEHRCDPLDGDSDDDGIHDGDDDSPAVEQKVEALLDALTCPQLETPGSITALGVTAVLDANTEFEETTCDALAARLVAGESVLVEIEILEDVLGALFATEVEAEEREHADDDDDEEL
jgi:hypothetical protein